MWLTDDIRLRPQPASDEPRSEVWVANQPTGTIVSGSVLEAAVRCGPRWLLFVTDGVPYEDMLAIHLLDEHGRLRDSARIGGPYNRFVLASAGRAAGDCAFSLHR